MTNGFFGPVTSNKTWTLEFMIDFVLLSTIYVGFGVNQGVFVILNWDSEMGFFKLDMIFRHKSLAVVISVVVSFMFRFWNYFLIVKYIRMKFFLVCGGFNIFRSVFLVFACWILCYTIVFLTFGLLRCRGLYISFEKLFNVASFLSVLGPGLTASMLAPILTYRLTGYCFDSDFSLPPWSHGRWGFRKPAAVAEPSEAATPAPIDRPDPDASPPTGSRGGA
jgi:hypothetical protein